MIKFSSAGGRLFLSNLQDNDVQTVVIRVRGADLAAFRARQMSRDDVIKRIEKRVF